MFGLAIPQNSNLKKIKKLEGLKIVKFGGSKKV